MVRKCQLLSHCLSSEDQPCLQWSELMHSLLLVSAVLQQKNALMSLSHPSCLLSASSSVQKPCQLYQIDAALSVLFCFCLQRSAMQISMVTSCTNHKNLWDCFSSLLMHFSYIVFFRHMCWPCTQNWLLSSWEIFQFVVGCSTEDEENLILLVQSRSEFLYVVTFSP